ncbi:MAG: DNA polymerase/3'-5' exonuclease PolX [Thermodesulfovibrionia bacterium]
MKNQEIAKVFNEIADILEIKGENPFRIRAYRRAAQNIDGLSRDVVEMSGDELMKIPGIGADLAGKIMEYINTGTVKAYEDLKRDVPTGIVNLLSVPGLGPKTAKMLFERLGIKDIDDLERYARDGRLRGLPGIQAKTEENILKGIEMLKRRTGRFPISRVLPIANEIVKGILKGAHVKEISLAGSLRRWKETIKDIDILAVSDDPKQMMNVFTHLPQCKDVLMKGPTKSSIVTGEGIQVDLRVVDEDSYGSALAYFTGSKAHNIRLREMAMKKGLKINEYGIFDVKTDKKLGGRREEDVYRLLGLPYIPPEMREDMGEIEMAIEGRIPRLIEIKDIKGDLHVHSRYSDGSHEIEEIVTAAKERGYKYIAITDHSKSLGIARGMSVEQVLEQSKRIRGINKGLKGFSILSGVELDIRSDGRLDYPDEVLKELDIVVASIHSGFKQSKEQMTMRLISAMKNPYVSIIAHPTGRLIGEREEYDVDMDELLRVAKETSTILEINAYPLRLDLKDIYIKRAKEIGIRFAISTDTHIDYQLDFITYGVGMARRGGLEKGDVVNTYSYSELMKILNNKRGKTQKV